MPKNRPIESSSAQPLDMDRYHERLRPRTFVSLFRSQIAAAIATSLDFGLVILLTEWLGMWYVLSNALGALCGAVVSFLLGRYWAFVSLRQKMKKQAFRYFWVALGSLLLNTLGVYLITEFSGINYVLSKVIISLTVGIAWNFVLHKYYVFR
ncbi:MAG: GtrA family protein [Bacteroidota bacterium]